jgi:hypothetical protein
MAALKGFLWSAPLLLCSVSDAWAYLDPGTGSFALQALIGILVTGGVAAKLFWQRVVAKFRGNDRRR